MALRALAGDYDEEPALVDRLSAEASMTRRQAAQALGLLGAHATLAAPRALLRAAQSEDDDAVFRELAYTAVRLGGPCPSSLRGVEHRLRSAVAQDAALLLMATCADSLAPRSRRRAGEFARRRLGADEDRARATGAWALALLQDSRATRTLLRRLEGETTPWVRRAFARAIWVLATPRHATDAHTLARIENDTLSEAWLREAGSPAAGTRHFATRGAEILRVQIRPVDPQPEGLSVELHLPDGRALVTSTLPDGLTLMVELPAGSADVEVLRL
jgi:hypothetical protein